MWTGTSALNSINQGLQTIRNEVVRLDSQLAQLTNQVASNQRHRAKLINDIASVRLSEIESGELNASYTAADQQSSDLLKQRDQALEDLNLQIDKLNERIHSAETERDSLLETVNQASERVVEIEGQVQQQLKVEPAYLEQFQRAQAAESVAEEAQQKMEQARANMTEKAAPYQADKLFMYLWGRAYGTTE